MVRIGLVGDYDATVIAHQAIPRALSGAASAVGGARVEWDWIHTSTIPSAVDSFLNPYAAIWCVPASPYANTAGALAAIRFARQAGRPFLGTCGGFQHALLEYAEAVWHITAPAHAELEPGAPDPVIAPLMCALVEVSETLRLVPGTRLAQIHGVESIAETYHCRFGLSPQYEQRLATGSLRVCAYDGERRVRAVELDGHPFFVATLFQPERSVLVGRTPPLVTAFVRAAVATATGELPDGVDRRTGMPGRG